MGRKLVNIAFMPKVSTPTPTFRRKIDHSDSLFSNSLISQQDHGLPSSRPSSSPSSLPTSTPIHKTIGPPCQRVHPQALLNLRSTTSIQTRPIPITTNSNNNTINPRDKRPNKHPPSPNRHPRPPPRLDRYPSQTQTPHHPRPRIPHLLQNRPQKRLRQLPRLPTPPQTTRSPALHPHIPAPHGRAVK